MGYETEESNSFITKWARDDRGYLYFYFVALVLIGISMFAFLGAVIVESDKLMNVGGIFIGFGCLVGLIGGFHNMAKEF